MVVVNLILLQMQDAVHAMFMLAVLGRPLCFVFVMECLCKIWLLQLMQFVLLLVLVVCLLFAYAVCVMFTSAVCCFVQCVLCFWR